MENNKQNKEERIEEYIRSYQELLAEKGYTETGLNNGLEPGALAASIGKAFRELSQFPARPDEAMLAVIQSPCFFAPEKEPVVFDFVFSYAPQAQSLKLVSLKAETHDLKMTCLLQLSSGLPALSEMLESIREARIKIAAKNSLPKRHIKGKRM